MFTVKIKSTVKGLDMEFVDVVGTVGTYVSSWTQMPPSNNFKNPFEFEMFVMCDVGVTCLLE